VAKKKSRSQRARAKARQAAANPIVQGQQAFHQGDYDAAIAAWEQALGEKPSARVTAALAEVHFRRGLARFHRDGQRSAGLFDLAEAAKLVADDPRYAYHLGLAHHHQGDLNAALAAYRLALDVDPSFVRAAELAVLALLEQERNPLQTAAWQALPPDRQAELQPLVGLLGFQTPAGRPGSPPAGRARLWRALATFQSGDGGAREVLLPIAQDGDEPAAARALAAYALGLDALRRERHEEALGHWEAARRLGLDTSTLRDNLHHLYHLQAEEAMAAGRWIDAADLVDAARSLAPGGRDLAELALAAHFHAGHAEAQAGRWQQALTHWEKSRDLGENSRELLQDLALANEKAGHYGQAADLWRQVVRRRPRKADAPTPQQVALLWSHVAECYRRAGDAEEAVTTLRNAVKNDPDNTDLRLELVDALVADDHEDAADNELDRLLKKEPKNVGALVRSARIAEMGWYTTRAKPIWRQVLALDPNHLEARERLAELLERDGDFLVRVGKSSEALERYHEALTYTPEEPHLYLACADCYLDQGNTETARQEMDRGFAQQPDDLDLYHSAVDLCHVRGRTEEAEWVIARAEELAGPRQPQGRLPAGFFLDLAECCFKRRQAEIGDDYVQRAERAAEGDADGLVDVGVYYLDRDLEGQATAFFDRALRVDPAHGWANYHVGAGYAFVAEMREANRHWRQARRTARQTGDQELLEAVESIRSQFQQMITMLERGASFEDALEVFDDESW
jgi:tetratricopeptide (TPR) repeat protein